MLDKKNYFVHIKFLKLALDYGLILEKVQKIIEFNQEAWLKPNIYMNTELRKKNKKWFWERLLQVADYFCVWEDYGECEESQRY